MNGAGELTCLRGQIPIGVLAQLLAQDQDAVERRAQLMGHVGQELGLVLGSQGQFLGFFFQGPAGLLNFLVLALHFHVLFGQLLGFLRELLVGLLQFCLLRLQLGASCWDCFSSPSVCMVASMLLRTIPMLAVSCSRNARCEAVKALNEASSMHRLYPILEEHRQHDDVARGPLATSRS